MSRVGWSRLESIADVGKRLQALALYSVKSRESMVLNRFVVNVGAVGVAAVTADKEIHRHQGCSDLVGHGLVRRDR